MQPEPTVPLLGMMSRMDWGIHLPHLGRQATRTGLIEFAQHAEALGFHSGWVSDHVAWPATISSEYPYTDDGSFAPPTDMPWLDPIGTMFFVAGCTETLKLAPTVLILGYRPPVLTAKAIASLDHLSEGRVILGVGIGWMREEFEVLGMPYDHRGKRADEQLELFRPLLRRRPAELLGRVLRRAGGRVRAQAAEPAGADLGRRRQRGRRSGARPASATRSTPRSSSSTPSRRAWARVRELVAAEGRDPASVRLSIRLYLDPEGSMPAAKSIAGSPAEMLDTVGRWQAIGVDHILLDPVAPGGLAGRRAAMERFMLDVAPQV